VVSNLGVKLFFGGKIKFQEEAGTYSSTAKRFSSYNIMYMPLTILNICTSRCTQKEVIHAV